MKGFDKEFGDFADYILRITDRIWKEKNIGAIRRYYAEDTIIYTLGGLIHGSEAIINSTISTLAAFPDRLLNAEAVLWSGDDHAGYYSSHRLISPAMTNLGHSEFGPPSGRQTTVRTIADCMARENQIHTEWLMRDNMGLVHQLGLAPHAVARTLAATNQDNKTLHDWLAAETARVASQPPVSPAASLPDARTDPDAFAQQLCVGLWRKRDLGMIDKAYAAGARAHGPGGRELIGQAALKASIGALHAALSDTRVHVDHVCSNNINEEETDIAVRWLLTGKHDKDGIYGPPCGKTLLYLIGTHCRLHQNRIAQEWTVFDELAVLRQLYSP